MAFAPRMLVVWCPDWSAAATGVSLAEPVAVIHANRVVSSSPAARREGVHVGTRRREAQAHCPDLRVFDVDEARDAKAFEPVVATVEALAPRVELLSPGVCAVPTLGPSRYFGGDEALLHHVTLMVNQTLQENGLDAHAGVGIADAMFAAGRAAKAVTVVPVGGSADFLAPQPIDTLEAPELVDLLKRLGIRTLGDFAALPERDVLGRFGTIGQNAQLRVRGFDEVPFQARIPALELAVETELDPPVAQLDQATFAAKALADRLHEKLGAQGLACNRLLIEADTESGDSLSRIWRHDGRLSAVAIAERLRWQIEGWLTRQALSAATSRAKAKHPSSGSRMRAVDPNRHPHDPNRHPREGGDPAPSDEPVEGGIVRLRLVPEGVLPDNGHQLGFWGGDLDAEERAGQALARVQSLVGEDAVVTAVVTGGRSPADQVRYVPWGVARDVKPVAQPWSGKLPVPSPATVYEVWPPATVRGAENEGVAVDGRGHMNTAPLRLAIEGELPVTVMSWAGPWLLDERWWDPTTARRRARLQVQTETGAYLLALEQQRWWVEAKYD